MEFYGVVDGGVAVDGVEFGVESVDGLLVEGVLGNNVLGVVALKS